MNRGEEADLPFQRQFPSLQGLTKNIISNRKVQFYPIEKFLQVNIILLTINLYYEHNYQFKIKENDQLFQFQPFKLQKNTVINILTNTIHLVVNNLDKRAWFYIQVTQLQAMLYAANINQVSSWRNNAFENCNKQVKSYHFSLLQKSYHNNIWMAILSLHGKYTQPDDKEIEQDSFASNASSLHNIHFLYKLYEQNNHSIEVSSLCKFQLSFCAILL